VQVAETVCEATLVVGEPTRNFIVGMLTHPAYEHDEVGALKMEQEQARMGLDKPSVQYVDSAYISAFKLVEAQTQGRELIGPALPGPQKDGRFTAAQFQINVEERHAVCPAGKVNTQCSRLVEASTGNIVAICEPPGIQSKQARLIMNSLRREGAKNPGLRYSTTVSRLDVLLCPARSREAC
jgi:hypothetical protein